MFVGVGRGCFLEEEDSAALWSNLSSFAMMVDIFVWRMFRLVCCLLSVVAMESVLSRESSTCSWSLVRADCMVFWVASRVVFFVAS